jgi:4-hydroxybenzoate polyprenyltransferase
VGDPASGKPVSRLDRLINWLVLAVLAVAFLTYNDYGTSRVVLLGLMAFLFIRMLVRRISN